LFCFQQNNQREKSFFVQRSANRYHVSYLTSEDALQLPLPRFKSSLDFSLVFITIIDTLDSLQLVNQYCLGMIAGNTNLGKERPDSPPQIMKREVLSG
jgi:hypothetical protein